MSAWQATFGDLESIGIPVSSGQREVLAHGGEVLVLQALPTPGWMYCCGDMHEQFDGATQELVVVPAVLHSFPIDIPCDRYERPRGANTIADLLDIEDGEHWRFWPSYTGDHTNLIDTMEFVYGPGGWTGERPVTYRIWDGIPVSEIGKATVDAIMLAANTMVEATPYYFIERMLGYQESEEDIPKIEDRDDPNTDVEYFETRDVLVKEDLWVPGEEDWSDKIAKDMVFMPMQELLCTNHQAQMAWERLLYQSRAGASKARRTIKKGQVNLYEQQERAYETWF